jgi:hypothetical protein
MPTTPTQQRAAAAVEYWRRHGDHQAARLTLLGLAPADRETVVSMVDVMNSYGAHTDGQLLFEMNKLAYDGASLGTEPDIDALEAEILADMAATSTTNLTLQHSPAVKSGITVSDAGEVSGIASTYGNVDLQDDMLEPGAWAESVAEIQQSGRRIPLLDWHGSSLSRVIGSVVELRDSAKDLWFRAGFTSDEQGQRARQLVRDGHLTGVSVGYTPLQGAIRSINGNLVRVLSKAHLHEISLTPIPANPLAQIEAANPLAQIEAANPLAQIEAAKGYDDFEANYLAGIDLDRARRERRDAFDLAVKAVTRETAAAGCGRCRGCRMGRCDY